MTIELRIDEVLAFEQPVLPLEHFARDEHSRHGEDGILEEIVRRLPPGSDWCVELRARGARGSRVRRLVDSGWSAVVVEADRRRATRLASAYRDRDDVLVYRSRVSWAGADVLDRILAPTPIPLHFDLLSIDVGADAHRVWGAVERYRPRVVVVEHSGAVASLGRSKGYELAATTSASAILVRMDLFEVLGAQPPVPRTVLPPLVSSSSTTRTLRGWAGRGRSAQAALTAALIAAWSVPGSATTSTATTAPTRGLGRP